MLLFMVVALVMSSSKLCFLLFDIDENETQCNLQLDDKEDNDVQYNQNVKEPMYGMRFSSEQELFLYYK
jgi:hypothetical protein